jgi:diguanylate cyclase (GGDEF)-like protein
VHADRVRRVVRNAQRLIDGAGQGAADIDQTAADIDQAASARDSAGAARDQVLSDEDQRASDLDQAAADSDDLSTAPASHAQSARDRSIARAQRAGTSAARAQEATTRAQTEVDRFTAAEQRDQAAEARDLACAARDLAAEAQDRLAALKDSTPAAFEARTRAANDRTRAALDRRRAAGDRESARLDREQLRTALTEGHVDDLTGTYRRTMGRIVLEAEIERAHRSTDQLVLAFVDVDGLKAHNDRNGHAAGDELLLEVVASIRSSLRPYDPVVRVGGDEFICALIDVDLNHARHRFRAIGASLKLAYPGASISVGLAELQPGDTLDDLIARGDAAVYADKKFA